MALVISSKSEVSERRSDYLAEIRSTKLMNVRDLVSEKKDPFQYKDINKIREEPEVRTRTVHPNKGLRVYTGNSQGLRRLVSEDTRNLFGYLVT